MFIQRTKVTGFTLLEALIAIVIVGVGFLGLAGLQLSALRDTNTSRNVTAATILARDMADRLRASGKVIESYNFSALPASAASCVGPTSTCTPTAFFESDYAAWRDTVSRRLPNGSGIVCRDTTPNDGTPGAPGCTSGAKDPLVVKLWWTEKGESLITQERFVMPLFARDGLMK